MGCVDAPRSLLSLSFCTRADCGGFSSPFAEDAGCGVLEGVYLFFPGKRRSSGRPKASFDFFFWFLLAIALSGGFAADICHVVCRRDAKRSAVPGVPRAAVSSAAVAAFFANFLCKLS